MIKNSQYRKIFHPESLLAGKDAANNCGNRAAGGGTGPGLGALILQRIAVDCIRKSKVCICDSAHIIWHYIYIYIYIYI